MKYDIIVTFTVDDQVSVDSEVVRKLITSDALATAAGIAGVIVKSVKRNNRPAFVTRRPAA